MKGVIDINGVIEVYTALSGRSAEDGKAGILCRSAAETLLRQLKSDCDCIREMGRLCYAAGCLAYYRGLLLDTAEGSDSFKAGDVTVTAGENTEEAARRLYTDAFASIRDLLCSGDFAFRRV